MKEINTEFEEKVQKEFDAQQEKKKNDRRNLNKKGNEVIMDQHDASKKSGGR
jgi:hypothetical protein